MNLELAGLTAVVTGGSPGIGAAIVRTLAEKGCHVALCLNEPTTARSRMCRRRLIRPAPRSRLEPVHLQPMNDP